MAIRHHTILNVADICPATGTSERSPFILDWVVPRTLVGPCRLTKIVFSTLHKNSTVFQYGRREIKRSVIRSHARNFLPSSLDVVAIIWRKCPPIGSADVVDQDTSIGEEKRQTRTRWARRRGSRPCLRETTRCHCRDSKTCYRCLSKLKLHVGFSL